MLASAAFRTSVAPGGALAGPWVRNSLWNAARAVPSLDLRFAENKSLVDATTGRNFVTFTRASSGTYVDSQGVIRNATTNLLLQSEDFSTTWVNSGSSENTNVAIAPNGTLTADALVDTAVNEAHDFNQTVTLAASTTYTFSMYLKQANVRYAALVFGVNASWGTGGGAFAYFDLQNGTVVGTSQVVASIINVGNGWYRCIATATTTASPSSFVLRVSPSVTGSSRTYTGSGTEAIYTWGAQLEQSSTVGEYIPTGATINSAPRFDHNPTTGESLGLLVEEQRTNLLLQSEDFSTTWAADGAASVATNTITSPASTLTADTLTVSGGGGNRVSQSYSAPSAGTYTLSVYAKAGTGNLLQLRQFSSGNDAYVIFNFSTGVMGSAIGGTSASASVTPLPNGWYRLALTNTYSGAASINIRIGGAVGSTETNTTFYLWGAQLEAGSFPTSYIPTTASTATRSADVASITGANFSSWYRQDEGTLLGDVSVLSTAKTQQTISLNDGTSNNRIELRPVGNGDFIRTDCVVAGVTKYSNQSISLSGLRRTSALAFKANDFRLQSGNLGVSPLSDAVPSVDRLYLNYATFAGGEITGTIRRLTYWPQRLPNNTLQAITQ